MNKLLLLVNTHTNYIVKFLISIRRRLLQNQWAVYYLVEKRVLIRFQECISSPIKTV